MRRLALFLLAPLQVLLAQNTLQMEQGDTSPTATIALVKFMEGHWTGPAFGGFTEEIWSPAIGGSMMFVFRHLIDDKVNFYEIGHIREVDNSLIFELKHFDANLHGWEAKDEVQRFKFIKTEGNRVYFDGFTFENISPQKIAIYGLIGNDDGTTTEMVFNYNRQ